MKISECSHNFPSVGSIELLNCTGIDYIKLPKKFNYDNYQPKIINLETFSSFLQDLKYTFKNLDKSYQKILLEKFNKFYNEINEINENNENNENNETKSVQENFTNQFSTKNIIIIICALVVLFIGFGIYMFQSNKGP